VTKPAAALGVRPAYLLMAAVILLWGANWPVMKVGLTYIPPLWFGALRMFMGAATLFAILLATRQLRLPRRGDLPVLMSVALFQMASFLALVNIALLFVEAGRAAVLAYTMPFWVTPAAVLLLGERLTARKISGLALGLAGLAVLFNPLGFDWSDPDVVLGNGLLMVSALAWAGAIVHIRMHGWVSSPLQLVPWQMLIAGPLLVALALCFEDPAEIRWSGELTAILAYNGLIATAFCFWAAVSVTRALPAISTALGFLGVPVIGVVASAAALGEALSPTLLGGLALIVAGIGLVNLPEARARGPT
jgi:drug/metabolite transporter (DMT)-like permease